MVNYTKMKTFNNFINILQQLKCKNEKNSIGFASFYDLARLDVYVMARFNMI